jgi:molybdopterin synthase sulfurtransferase
MGFIKQKRYLMRGLTLLSLVITLSIFIACGGGQYSDPEVGAEVMVSPQTLNSWVTTGYGTDAFGYSKIVILDVNTKTNYEKEHVPGAYLLDQTTEVGATRSDGVAETISQVVTKAQMDDIIQRTGIDENTVVVITGTNMMQIGRAYFNFRYWGFPRYRLKVLNGTTAGYKAEGFDLVGTYPAPAAPSTFSVCNLEQNTHLRASFAEMMQVAADDDATTVVVDVRTPNEFNGVVGATGGAAGGTKVAFEGHIRTAVHSNYVDLTTSGNAASPLKTAEEIKAIMSEIGVSSTDTNYSYCRTSWRAGVHFLALDALLGWPSKIYDGAWIEWGQMADNGSAIGGALAATSPWRTDHPLYSAAITYNKPAGFTIDVLAANSFAQIGDLINRTDANACGTGGGGGGGAQTGGY